MLCLKLWNFEKTSLLVDKFTVKNGSKGKERDIFIFRDLFLSNEHSRGLKQKSLSLAFN